VHNDIQEVCGKGTGSRININFSLGIIIIKSGTDYFRCSSLAFHLIRLGQASETRLDWGRQVYISRWGCMVTQPGILLGVV